MALIAAMCLEELWGSVISEERGDHNVAWQEVIRACWPEDQRPFQLEREHQRQCRDAIVAAQGDQQRRRRYLHNPPLSAIPDCDRENVLDEAFFRALRRGYQLNPPAEFERWFSGIRRTCAADYWRRRPNLLNVLDETFGEVPWPEPEDSAEGDPFTAIRHFLEVLSSSNEPGTPIANAAFAGLYDILELEDGHAGAAWDCLYGLKRAAKKRAKKRSPPALEFQVFTFGQGHHLARLPPHSPWYQTAHRCLGVMEVIPQKKVALVVQVAECLAEFRRLRSAHGFPQNPACGDLFHHYLGRLFALRVLASCWQLATHLLGPPCSWPSQAANLGAFTQFLEQGRWRNNLGKDRPRTSAYWQTWRELAEQGSQDAQDRSCLLLLLLWLPLLANWKEMAVRQSWEVRIYLVDHYWWLSRLTGQHVAEAERAAEAVYREFVATTTGCWQW